VTQRIREMRPRVPRGPEPIASPLASLSSLQPRNADTASRFVGLAASIAKIERRLARAIEGGASNVNQIVKLAGLLQARKSDLDVVQHGIDRMIHNRSAVTDLPLMPIAKDGDTVVYREVGKGPSKARSRHWAKAKADAGKYHGSKTADKLAKDVIKGVPIPAQEPKPEPKPIHPYALPEPDKTFRKAAEDWDLLMLKSKWPALYKLMIGR
jgi:hypothetical protein